jgi:nitrate reductase gamma subunit
MRKTNWRLVIVGSVMILLACGFFVFMAAMAKQSNDPATLMQTVGTVSGVVGGLGAVMALFGLIGRRRQDARWRWYAIS